MLQQQTQSPGWRVLNRDVIKYIAMTAMLLNHIANIFLVPGTLWYEVLVDIGYFTAITMCYFLVEGFRYTHSRKQYALRLFGFGVVSQVPFSMAFAQKRHSGISGFQHDVHAVPVFLHLVVYRNHPEPFFARRADRTADFWFVVL